MFAPSLTGLGERSHLLSASVDLDTHITDVVALWHYEDLRDVVLVGHSYGGMVITGVVDRSPDRVGKVGYLDAANPRNGQSLVDVAGPIILAARELGAVRDGIHRHRARPDDHRAGLRRRRAGAGRRPSRVLKTSFSHG